MVEARRRVRVRQPPHPVLWRSGDHDPVGDLVRGGFERALNVAGRECLGDRRHAFRLDPVPLEERRRHRGDVERGEDSSGAARDVGVGCDRAEQGVTEIETVRVSACALDPGLKVLHRVVQRLR